MSDTNGHPPTDKITRAITKAIRENVREHALLGRSVPTSVDGKIVWVTPEESLARLAALEAAEAAAGDAR